MPALARRREVVKLYPGDLDQRLSAKLDAAMAAQRAEETRPRRFGEKSDAMRLAAEYDAEVAAAEEQAVEVTVWAISRLHWSPLADEHPPRSGYEGDLKNGLNMSTFPAVLLLASLVAPEGEEGVTGPTCKPTDPVSTVLAKGEIALDAIGDLSQAQYHKLSTAAWAVNVGGDSLPKYSLVSLLKAARETDSEPPPDSE